MNRHILNMVNQLLAYNDTGGTTDNPKQRSFDWVRRYSDISISNPVSDTRIVPPGASLTVFDGIRSTGVTGGTTFNVVLMSGQDSSYRLTASTADAFRTARAVSGVTSCAVAVNNNCMASFNFTAATLTGVIVGDIMRLDSGVDPLNQGVWIVVGISGTSVSCVRPTGEPFSGINESAAAPVVSFYSSNGVQKGDRIVLGAGFSPVSQKTFEVADARPTTLDFISASPLPAETAIAGSLIVYTSAKRMIYCEADQECVLRFNGDTGDSNKVSPIAASDQDLPGFFHKWGDMYSCVIVNKSVNALKVKFLLGE